METNKANHKVEMVDVKGLTKKFNGKTVLLGLYFQIHNSEKFGYLTMYHPGYKSIEGV